MLMMTLDKILNEVDILKNSIDKLNLSTQSLLTLIPHLRLDWSEDSYDFVEEFDIGVTKPLLFSGLAPQSRKERLYNKFFEHNSTAKLLADTFLLNRHLTTDLVKQIHKLIIREGGYFRNEEVAIGERELVKYPPFSKKEQITSDLSDLIDWYNLEIKKESNHPIFIASIFHYNFVRIHPFPDGNGRLARIISSLILLSFNFPPPTIEVSDRVIYLNSLRNADSGNIQPLIIFIAERVVSSMKYTLTITSKHNG